METGYLHADAWGVEQRTRSGEAHGRQGLVAHRRFRTPRTDGSAGATGWHEVLVTSGRLGHANVAITIDTYSHVLPAADAETARTLTKLILGGSRVRGFYADWRTILLG